MKTIEAEISDGLDQAIDMLVERGWYASRDEVLQEALHRFLEAHQPELMERFIRQDVEWGLRGDN
jgi:Arc/MetJ-type ribon-helix-helix transcriptional regulator